ncbi:MAG: DUF2169 domain-containing protein [Limnobaculum xujianqingii]
MEIFNAAKHTVADVVTSLDKEGREHLVIIIKATYRFPLRDRGVVRPILPPQPLVVSDIYTAEAGESAVLYEADYVRYKAKCDVLFDAQAHIPEGKEDYRVCIKAKVGEMDKDIKVTGDRFWRRRGAGWSASKPTTFTSIPLNYEYAFGGVRRIDKNGDEAIDCFKTNLVGTGYSNLKNDDLDGYRLPNLEALSQTLQKPNQRIEPLALSVRPRNHPKRQPYAGTYDEKWRKEIFPFLPADFDEFYFQSAPPDQQIDFPLGGEAVVLMNMHPEKEYIEFHLPRMDNIPVRILKTNYQAIELMPHADTLYFEPDAERFSVVWRASVPIQKRIQEFHTVAIGPVGKVWWHNRTLGSDSCFTCRNSAEGEK